MAQLRFLLAILFAAAIAQAQPPALIIDTDAGSDDLMAISFLLAHPSVHIEAITVANGLAHVDAGARNLVRLLELRGRINIPVFAGRSTPLRGNAEFPAEWRKTSDELPGVTLPAASRPPEPRKAADYLVGQKRPVRILALGPLTNLAEALNREPSIAANIQEIVIMGGAVRVPGNLTDGDLFKTPNKTAEWNIFVDPFAARIVFRSGIPIRLIPLDATNKVPIDLAFLRDFSASVHSPLGRFVTQVLESDKKSIEDGYFYAWDPLAAVALLHPAVVKTRRLHIDVLQDPPQDGRTMQAPGTPNAAVALDADAAAFRRIFLQAFQQ
ncbi:MAG TPA: nucleoside hydrolase [Bryobacteraceae bacterium]|nr:nucleoside hydrolase [Bryobacteraceae bacterium]